MIAKIRAKTLAKAKKEALKRNPDFLISSFDVKATWTIRMRRKR